MSHNSSVIGKIQATIWTLDDLKFHGLMQGWSFSPESLKNIEKEKILVDSWASWTGLQCRLSGYNPWFTGIWRMTHSGRTRKFKAHPLPIVRIADGVAQVQRKYSISGGGRLSDNANSGGKIILICLTSWWSGRQQKTESVFNQSSTGKRAFRRLSCGGIPWTRRKTFH